MMSRERETSGSLSVQNASTDVDGGCGDNKDARLMLEAEVLKAQ